MEAAWIEPLSALLFYRRLNVKEKYTVGRGRFRTFEEGIEKEWIITNGIGGFASQSIIGANTRSFSGYLIASLHAPVDRRMILPGTHEMVRIQDETIDLVSQSYMNQYRRGYQYLNQFVLDGIPTYIYQVRDAKIRKTVALEYGKNTCVVCYEIENGMQDLQLCVTPLFTYRDFGEVAEKNELKFACSFKELKRLNKENDKYLALIPEKEKEVEIKFYSSQGQYFDRREYETSMATPNYLIEENEVYLIDNRNGFLGVDNHFTPYEVRVDVKPYEKKKFYIKCTLEELDEKDGFCIADEYRERIKGLMDKVSYTDTLARRLTWAADAFIVDRESTGLKTILAGYPWFADWGRDTMIALQGLTLATGRYEDAKAILTSFSMYVKDGMIPNVFPKNAQEEPMYNTIDASLWYFYSVDRYLAYTKKEQEYTFIKEEIYPYLKQIIKFYKEGTNFFIRMDEDFLIEGGSDLDQLTWMDVRVGNLVVTPRHGKAVEINALWYNALKVMEGLARVYGEASESAYYEGLAKEVKKSFCEKFWNEAESCLYDVIEKENGEEKKDASIRPNQIFAVSLPYTMLDVDKEMQVVRRVYHDLYTPYGIRSLSYADERYQSQYIGKLLDRDKAYHMGTSWAYLSGAFITAYCKVNRHSKESILLAKEMCEYFSDQMQDGCLNGIAEIFDGDFACTSRGCYTQAWSVGEILRAYTEDVLPYV